MNGKTEWWFNSRKGFDHNQASMSRLDRYIIKQLLGTFAFMLIVFCVIVVVFDLMEHLSRLLDHQAPFADTALYYVNVCFHFASLLMGFIVFLTIIWFTSRLAQTAKSSPCSPEACPSNACYGRISLLRDCWWRSPWC